MRGFVMPARWRLQCPACGVPIVEVDTPRPFQGVIVLQPCGHETTQAEMGLWLEGHEQQRTASDRVGALADAIESYLRLYLLAANVRTYHGAGDDHASVAARCAPLLAEHIAGLTGPSGSWWAE